MLEGRVRHGDHQFVGRKPIGLNDDGTILAFGRIQQGTDFFESCLLIAKINGRRAAAGDADDLLILQWAKRET